MESKFLSDQEIIQTIKEYIDDTVYNRAILIDGTWGSGKTFFIKNKLIKALEDSKSSKEKNQKKIIYISLYGVESTVDITNEIYLNSVKSINKDSKVYSLAVLSGKFASDLMKNKGFDIIKYAKDAKGFIDISNCVLIFDDLERCKCNLSDILGYINNFVEHKGMKVIIVTNEDEIGNTSDEGKKYIKNIKTDRAQKDKEIIESFNNSMNLKNEDKANNNTINIDRTDKTEEYLKVKEKLIGTTIKYKPNLEESINFIIEDNIKEDSFKTTLKNNISIFTNLLEENEHINLRTFQFFILKISKIYSWIKDKDYTDDRNVLNEVIKYTFTVCIYLKKGLYMNEWKTNNLYGEVSLEPYDTDENIGHLYPDKTVKGFRFIDNFVVYNKITDIKVIDRTIELFIEDLKQAEDINDPINKLKDYYWLEDCEVENFIKEVYTRLKGKKYSPQRFPTILKVLIDIKYIGFEIDKKMFDIMIEQIQESRLQLNYDERIFEFSDNKEIQEEYMKYYKRMKLASVNNHEKTYFSEINECIEDIDSWGSKLRIFIKNNCSGYNLENGVLSKLDMRKLKNNIENSTTKELDDFRWVIHSIYAGDISKLKSDKEAIKNLINIISEVKDKNKSKTKKLVLKWFKENLEDILKYM